MHMADSMSSLFPKSAPAKYSREIRGFCAPSVAIVLLRRKQGHNPLLRQGQGLKQRKSMDKGKLFIEWTMKHGDEAMKTLDKNVSFKLQSSHS